MFDKSMFYEVIFDSHNEDFPISTMRLYVVPGVDEEDAIRTAFSIWKSERPGRLLDEITVRPARLERRRILMKVLAWIDTH